MLNIQINDRFKDFIVKPLNPISLLIGGYGSSKSHHIMIKLIIEASENKRKIIIARQTYRALKDSAFNLLLKVLDDANIPYKSKIVPLQVTLNNGSVFIFIGLDDTKKLKSLDDISIAFIEEASETNYDSYSELLGRLRHSSLSNHIILSSNPASKLNWIFKFFFENNDITEDELLAEKTIIKTVHNITYYIHHSTVFDNAFIQKDYIDRLLSYKYTDQYRYDVGVIGKFGTLGDKVIEFEVGDYKEIRGNSYVGGDLGFVTSYNAIIRVVINGSNLYITDEHYKKGQTNFQLADSIKSNPNFNTMIYFDSAKQTWHSTVLIAGNPLEL